MDKKMSIRVVRKTGVFGFWKPVHFKLDEERFAEIRNEEELTIDLHREGARFSINYNEVFDLSNKVTVKNGDVVLIRYTWLNYMLYALLVSILLLPVVFPVYDYFGLWALFPMVVSIVITAKYSNTFKVEVLENIHASERSRQAVAREREEEEEEYGGVINYRSSGAKPPRENGKT